MSPGGDLLSALTRLLSNTSLGLPLIALVADVIAEDARFNDWMAIEGKQTLDDDAMLDAIEKYEEARLRCLAAVKNFETSMDLSVLDCALRKTLVDLKSARQRNLSRNQSI
jgi:hypothetical protein